MIDDHLNVDVLNIYGATQQIADQFESVKVWNVFDSLQSRESITNKMCGVFLQFALKIAIFQRDTSTFEL